MPALIEDYALVGDGHTAALISRDGSVDWLCWPRFDSGACFAALVGTPDHGRWLIRPSAEARITASSRRYRGETLILETDYECETGAVTVVDFMPPGNGWSELVRIVIGKRGHVPMQMELVLRFDYGFSIPWVTRLSREAGMKAIAGPDTVVLRTPVPLAGENLRTVAEFTVHAEERVPFSLGYAPSHLRLPPAREPLSMLARTENHWLEWSSRCPIQGRYADAVRRSLITLKALAYEPTGGIVAAPTTSLPEHIGGTRNWDYRYCWLRDATITLLALMRAGYYDEARAWRAWLGRVMAGSPEQIQIMYGIAGERRLPEMELDWLPGYQDSKPVRIGNNAANQLQLDVFGEVMPRCTWRAWAGCRPTIRSGRYSARCSPISRRSGASPTRASGRRAAAASTSPSRRSWPGSRSTAPSSRPSSSACPRRSTTGARCARRSTRTSAPTPGTRPSRPSRRATAATSSTPAC